MKKVNTKNIRAVHECFWLRGLDLNQRPLGYEPSELPGCSTPRHSYNGSAGDCQTIALTFFHPGEQTSTSK